MNLPGGKQLSAQTALGTRTAAEPRDSWVPMIAIALGQMIMSFNVASLPVASSGTVNSFGVPPTTVAIGIVACSVLVAGFVTLSVKLIQRLGAPRAFRFAVDEFRASQVLMTFSPNAALMITAQSLCRASAAPAQVDEAVRINTESRLRALKIGLLVMAGLALRTILPAGRLTKLPSGRATERSRAGERLGKASLGPLRSDRLRHGWMTAIRCACRKVSK
jgi:hypothetical protein